MRISSYKTPGGLNTHVNPYSLSQLGTKATRPRSATVICDNVILTHEAMLGPRTGFNWYTEGTGGNVKSYFEFEQFIVEHQDDNTLWLGTNTDGTRSAIAGTYSPGGEFIAPTATAQSGTSYPYRMDGQISMGSLFATTMDGIYKYDPSGTLPPIRAGAPTPLDVRAESTGTGGGWLSGNGQVGYRQTWVRTDNNGQVTESAPSEPTYITLSNQVSVTITRVTTTATATTSPNHTFANGDTIEISGADQGEYNGSHVITVTGVNSFTYTVSGSPPTPATGQISARRDMDVDVSFTVPADILPGDVWRIYRTATASSTGPAEPPGDEMFLVASGVYAGDPLDVFTYTDISPPDLLTVQLYTNKNEEGIGASNFRPPWACSVEVFFNFTFYGNTRLVHSKAIELLGVSGIVNGDTLTLHDVDSASTRTYTFAAAENIANQEFLLYTASTPSQNVAATMQSLCRVINGDPSGRWYCVYTSGFDGSPGIVNVFARDLIAGQFFITTNNGTVGADFSPVLPTSGDAIASDNDARPNRLFWSKSQQPDSVPAVVDKIPYFLDLGARTFPIERLIALREGVYAIKQDGIYFIQNNQPPFNVTKVDATGQILAPSSAVVLNNAIYMLTSAGVLQIASQKANVVSIDIDPTITALLSFPNLRTTCFAVADESQRTYNIWLPETAGSTVATNSYMLHVFENQWTRWTYPAQGGICLRSNLTMYLSSTSTDAVVKNRKTGSNGDYCDEALPIAITAQDDRDLTITWTNLATPSEGYVVSQPGVQAKVVDVNFEGGSVWTFTIDRDVEFDLGAAEALTPIMSWIRFPPDPCDDIGITKVFRRVDWLPLRGTVSRVLLEYSTNQSTELYTFPITRQILGGWGSNPWGATAWGDFSNPISSIPFTIAAPLPDTKAEACSIGFRHAVATEPYFIVQAAIVYEQLAEAKDIQSTRGSDE